MSIHPGPGPRHFLTLEALGRDGIEEIVARAAKLAKLRGSAEHPKPLAGKSIALVMEKASTRTRVSFEVGIVELGGHPLALAGRDLQIGRGEPIEDTARVLSRYVHAIVHRTFAHATLERLAEHATVPVINALSDAHHPCQLLADLATVRARFGSLDAALRVAWIGDGNNVAASWIEAAALIGFELRIACPEGHEPARAIVERARGMGRGRIEIGRDVAAAARGAHVVTTDVWASMGQEGEADARRAAFVGYTVDEALMDLADPSAIFLHCLPAHRGEEVSAQVIDGARSRVWEEAEHRLHTQKALLEWVLAG